MKADSVVYVAGHTGLVGSAIRGALESKGYRNLIFRTLKELDLTDQQAVDNFFAEEKPEYVFLAAALVGGIVANNTYRADFIYQNIMIQSNVIRASWKHGVKKLLFLGSTCIYPKNAPQPLREDYLLSSPLEYTNEPYAIAKIAGLKMCESFNIQYNTNFISVMPTNLYGPGDNYNLKNSHVLPALLRKIHLGRCLETGDWKQIRKDLDRYPVDSVTGASEANAILEVLAKYGIRAAYNMSIQNPDGDNDPEKRMPEDVTIEVWGTGAPMREFMYSIDMAEACVYAMENIDVNDIIRMHNTLSERSSQPPHFINIGTQEEITIKDLAGKIRDMTGFTGKIEFDTSKPDGTMRKTTDITLLKGLGYRHKFNLSAGLAVTYKNYLG